MALQTGFRTYVRVDYDPANGVVKIDPNGAVVWLEVTNPSADTDIEVTVNAEHNQRGYAGIPVLAGTTRSIPMTGYDIKATGPCIVIGYRL